MAQDLIRLMHALFLPAAERFQQCCWQPAADVYHGPSRWLIKFDLAGVRPEDISVSVCGRCLTVRGSRRDRFVTEGCQPYQMEIAYSEFERSLELPCNLEPARIATEYRDGMLLVTIQMEEAQT
jgi:HSP20 family protein